MRRLFAFLFLAAGAWAQTLVIGPSGSGSNGSSTETVSINSGTPVSPSNGNVNLIIPTPQANNISGLNITQSGNYLNFSIQNIPDTVTAGAAYTLPSTDCAGGDNLIVVTGSGNTPITIPQAVTSSTFLAGCSMNIVNLSSGTVSFAVTTSSYNGGANTPASLSAVSSGVAQFLHITSWGTNGYAGWEGSTGGGVSLSSANTWTATQTFNATIVGGSSTINLNDGGGGLNITNGGANIEISFGGIVLNSAGGLAVITSSDSSGAQFGPNQQLTIDLSGHLLGTTTATFGCGAGAGTSPTCSSAGSDLDGTFAITTGTSPAASGAIATLTFVSSYGTAPRCFLQPANAATASLTGTSAAWPNASASSVVLTAGSTALSASTAYKWYYTCEN
jgi:hypothetical protein